MNSADRDLTLVAVYQRTVHASLARIWENVLDWEHLPWLHRSSFTGIRLHAADAEGWRADVTIAGTGPRDALIDVRLERGDHRYLTRTLAGAGAGSEILTRLDPVDRRTTRIAVEFRVPGVAPADADAVGAIYTRLYARLWDEDEGMMVRRQGLLDNGLLPRPPLPELVTEDGSFVTRTTADIRSSDIDPRSRSGRR